jgi:hypothetical protein
LELGAATTVVEVTTSAVTVNTEQAAAAVPKIVDTLDKFGVRVPIIGDFHYNGHILLKKYPECARFPSAAGSAAARASRWTAWTSATRTSARRPLPFPRVRFKNSSSRNRAWTFRTT